MENGTQYFFLDLIKPGKWYSGENIILKPYRDET